jgi:hypothetical protein
MNKMYRFLRFNLYWGFIFIQFVFTEVSFSKEMDYGENSISEMVEKSRVKKFKGWKTIVFICSGDNSYKELICNSSQRNFEFLARSSKTNYIVTNNWNNYYQAQTINREDGSMFPRTIGLELRFVATNTNHTDAISFILTATANYPNAISKRKSLANDDPRKTPKSLDVVVWNSDIVIGASNISKTDLAEAVNNAIEDKLKEFFIYFMKANPE